jgi:hypothetical protein
MACAIDYIDVKLHERFFFNIVCLVLGGLGIDPL